MKIAERQEGKIRCIEPRIASQSYSPKKARKTRSVKTGRPDEERMTGKSKRTSDRTSNSRLAQNSLSWERWNSNGRIDSKSNSRNSRRSNSNSTSNGKRVSHSNSNSRCGSWGNSKSKSKGESESKGNGRGNHGSNCRFYGWSDSKGKGNAVTAIAGGMSKSFGAGKFLQGNEKTGEQTGTREVQEVGQVVSPVRKILGAITSVLTAFFGPVIFLFVFLLLAFVIILFLFAWMISVLFSWVSNSTISSYWLTGVMPYYCQQDEAWASYSFNGHTIYSDGCGVTAMAMIMACETRDYTIQPPTIVDLGYNPVQSHGAIIGIASVYGITEIEQMAGPSRNDCGVSRQYDLSYLQEKIQEGCPVLVSISGTYLDVTTQGHYLALYGQGENGVYVYDPANFGRIYRESINGGGSDWNQVLQDAKHIWIFPAVEIPVEGDSNAEKIFDYLVKAGWSKAAAAAVVGNCYQESGGGGTADINPASYSKTGRTESGGIVQWTDSPSSSNFTALKNYADRKGKEWTDLTLQCEFLVCSLANGTWTGSYQTPTYKGMVEHGYSVQMCTAEEFTQMTDVEEATKAFLCFFEDCGYEDAHYEDVRLPKSLQAMAAWGS